MVKAKAHPKPTPKQTIGTMWGKQKISKKVRIVWPNKNKQTKNNYTNKHPPPHPQKQKIPPRNKKTHNSLSSFGNLLALFTYLFLLVKIIYSNWNTPWRKNYIKEVENNSTRQADFHLHADYLQEI